MIILEDVHFAYDGLYTALQGVSLQIDDGERIAVMGSNGAAAWRSCNTSGPPGALMSI